MIGVSAKKLCLSGQPMQKQFHDLSPEGGKKEKKLFFTLPANL